VFSTDLSFEEKERLALDTHCPVCAAPPKVKCRWSGSPKKTGTHSWRRRRAFQVLVEEAFDPVTVHGKRQEFLPLRWRRADR
jgi:hypothetical protein